MMNRLFLINTRIVIDSWSRSTNVLVAGSVVLIRFGDCGISQQDLWLVEWNGSRPLTSERPVREFGNLIMSTKDPDSLVLFKLVCPFFRSTITLSTELCPS